MGSLGHETNKVPERVMRGSRLRVAAIGLHFHRMHEIGKFDRILDEEDRNVVADEIPIAFLGVELDGEAPDVPHRVRRSRAAGDRRKSNIDLGLFADLRQHARARIFRQRLPQLEKTAGAGPARVDDAFGDALMVKMKNLFAEMEILQKRWTPSASAKRVLIVEDGDAMTGRQDVVFSSGALMQFAAGADHDRCFSPAIGRFRCGTCHIISFSQMTSVTEQQKFRSWITGATPPNIPATGEPLAYGDWRHRCVAGERRPSQNKCVSTRSHSSAKDFIALSMERKSDLSQRAPGVASRFSRSSIRIDPKRS